MHTSTEAGSTGWGARTDRIGSEARSEARVVLANVAQNPLTSLLALFNFFSWLAFYEEPVSLRIALRYHSNALGDDDDDDVAWLRSDRGVRT